ncbi:response regulator [Stieleria varia]|uniref:Transcriptional regulatory protein OmpR n=1 Tax=Stieleria varia TaxID=2528005 RepID=A0A5C5ZZX7_9BACT|nr:response regulator [Stieleria varia]TWT92706.1 Transcriptional regulatory protein OmpR [Stieleria varia]
MTQRLRVLVVDDNPQDRRLVIRELKKAFPQSEVLEAIDQEQLDKILLTEQFDLVVTDYHLHWSDGIQVLRNVKERSPYCPVIMFTATGNEDVAVEAMKHGLDDYIIKSVKHFVRLRAAVRTVVEFARTRSRVEHLTARLESVLSQLSVGVFSCDPAGRFMEVNDAMLQLLGYESADQATQSGLVSLFPNTEQGNRFLQSIRESDQRQEFEIEQDTDEGRKCYRITAKRSSAEFEPVFIDGLVEDVTQLKNFEIEIRQAAVASAQLAMLSPREREVFDEVVSGKPNKTVARKMQITEKTVEKHRASMMRKLGARSVTDLVRLAMLSQSPLSRENPQ